MKQLLLLAMLFPLAATAQEKTHHFQNDTLYTSCGYKIYPGQTLHIGKRANEFIGFRYLNNLSIVASSLENNSVVVTDLFDYGTSPTGSAIITVRGNIVYRDGSKGKVVFTIAFDLAIGSRLPGTTSDLILPKENLISKEQAIAMHKPAFENDTLYTSCGYKIYKGQYLQLGQATTKVGLFRYINILSGVSPNLLENQSIQVEEIKNLTFSVLGNAYIDITSSIVLKNKHTKDVVMHIAFDHAIENFAGVPSEIVVPDEYKGVLKNDPEQEVERLEALYKADVISKEKMEELKKKLLTP